MPRPSPNALRWDGRAGHYEVFYLTLTDGASGVGVWIRYTMTAPGEAALWFVADDPGRGVIARKALRPIDKLQARSGELRIGDALLADDRMVGGFDDVAWDLGWTASGRSYKHVHPVAERLGLAQSVLELPHADLAIEGAVTYAGTRLELQGARGGQAHIWGSKHADNWAWVHCNDLHDDRGEPVPGAFIDAVSVRTRRGGREIGPFTPVVGRFEGRDFLSVSPLRVLTNWSSYALSGWRFEAIADVRKLVVEVDAEREHLAGVTYHDPDGDLAYCYNTETASIRLHLYERAPRVGGWTHAAAFGAQGRAHFEYAQRTPVLDRELHLT
ncbi:MAG TPA: hypothetical protein VLC49_14330 [Solirubrobacteraceae bacterium]|nr:hypothetical protein [Solirubrobacteraceae bacterium]